MKKPTAREVRSPFGQTTWGRPPTAPYACASNSSLRSTIIPIQRRQDPPGIEKRDLAADGEVLVPVGARPSPHRYTE